jgi:Sap, sulfolipid-1-addressing protein
MWTFVLMLGVGLAIDPVRLGLTVVMMSQRRPIRNLLAFWGGGMLAGVGIGIAVLLLMGESALVAIRAVGSAISELRSATVIFDGPRLQIIGGTMLLITLVMSERRARAAARVPVASGTGSTLVREGPSRNPFVRLGAIAQNLMNCDNVWPAFLIGLSSFPPYEGVVLLGIIMASGTAIGTQFGALMVFFLILLAAVEIPLVAYLVTPDKTLAAMLKAQDWLRAYRRQIGQVIVGVTGAVFLVGGVASYF